MGNDAPLLDLDALVPKRPSILIRTEEAPEGRLFELRTRPEFSVVDLKRIERLGQGAMEFSKRPTGEFSEAEIVQIEGWLEEMLQLIFAKPIDEKTLGALRIEQKVEIVEVFTRVCLPNRESKRAKVKKTTATGAK